MAADDLVQDTIVRALGAQAQFQPGTSLKAWLFTIQRNAFYEQKRRRAREEEILNDMENEPTAGTDRATGMHDSVMDLSGLLWKLPETFREALILIGAQELSYEEAAEICGCAVGTMKARVSRARVKLAELAGSSHVTQVKSV